MTLTSKARIEVVAGAAHGRESCNMCWPDDEPVDVKVIELYSPTGQNIFCLSLCAKHRAALKEVL